MPFKGTDKRAYKIAGKFLTKYLKRKIYYAIKEKDKIDNFNMNKYPILSNQNSNRVISSKYNSLSKKYHYKYKNHNIFLKNKINSKVSLIIEERLRDLSIKIIEWQLANPLRSTSIQLE